MRRKRRSVTQWKQIIENWQNSDLPVSRFCRENKIPVSAFYRWRMKFSEQEAYEQASFVQVDLPATRDSKLELTLRDGHVLRFTDTTNKKGIVSVLAALKEVGLC